LVREDARAGTTPEQADDHSESQREAKHGRIQSHAMNERDVWRQQSQQRIGDPEGEGEAHSGTRERQQHAFGGELTKKAASAGAQGKAEGHLFLAVDRASQKKIGHVDAADEKDESDCTAQKQEKGSGFADDRVTQRQRDRAKINVAGIPPITVKIWRLSETERPVMSGTAANWRCQSP
jgi:hypothetical protein